MRKTNVKWNDTLISDRVLNIQKIPNSVVIQSRLLSGDYHYQTVGKASDNILITCEVQEEEKDILQNAFLNVEAITVSWMNKEYVGKIDQMPTCEPVIAYVENRLYSSTFTVICPRG